MKTLSVVIVGQNSSKGFLLSSCSVVFDSCDPMDSSSLLYAWDFPGKNTGVGCHFPSPGDLPNPQTKLQSPVSPALQVDSLPTNPLGKPVVSVECVQLSLQIDHTCQSSNHSVYSYMFKHS